MPATSNATANMSRRQAFNGKGLTFIEMIFDTEVTETATTPDTKDSAFEICSQVVEEKGTLLAKSYALGCKATEKDAAIAASITEDDLCDVYNFIVEGTPGQFNNNDSVGDINLDPHQANSSDPGVIADAEADLEVTILANLTADYDSAGSVHVDVRYIPSDGVTSAGAEAVYGTSSARVNG